MKRSFLFIMAVVCFILETNAQIRNVPADLPTIQAGIDAANDGDTVLVAEGTFFENINFKGKAVTVASLFILDGDTSHISRTIIDGSQASNPDSSSTVIFCSGEDTTSLLEGFTITGGKGTNYDLIFPGDFKKPSRGGGGVYMNGSGGKIVNNYIIGNHVEKAGDNTYINGGGIFVFTNNNHATVIRNNIIWGNSIAGWCVFGGGVSAFNGRILFEGNVINNNSAHADASVLGGGMHWENIEFFRNGYEKINEVVIRNNLISFNSADAIKQRGGGGGFSLANGTRETEVLVYNNIIHNNHTESEGGGAIFSTSRVIVFNNTIVNNTASLGNNLAINGKEGYAYCNNILRYSNETLALFNNIIWSPEDCLNTNITTRFNNGYLYVFNNLLCKPFEEGTEVTAFYNIYDEPKFEPGTFDLAGTSPGIGMGIDSVQIKDNWNYAPLFDFYGKTRPNPVDQYIDLGAIESPYDCVSPPLIEMADLLDITLWDKGVEPSFHKDTLHYLLCIPDTVERIPQLNAIPAIDGVNVDFDPATDLRSVYPADRATTLHVTALDGITRKTYTVEFNLKSTDVLLSELSVSKGILVPPFDPQVDVYTVCLPSGTKVPPGVNLVTSHPDATTDIIPAQDITSNVTAYRKTMVQVISEYGESFQKYYYIEFNVDKNPPRLSLESDLVPINDSIRVISTKKGTLFLLPGQADADLDSLLAHMTDSTRAVMNDTISLATEDLDPGVYWLYAVNPCGSVSEEVTVTVFDPSVNTGQKLLEIGLNIYPNPVKNLLTIETGGTGKLFIEISSLNGHLVYKADVTGSPHLLDFSTFEKGIYFITIRSNDYVTTRKLIKL